MWTIGGDLEKGAERLQSGEARVWRQELGRESWETT